MATFHGQTVDIYEDFEDSSLATGLTESDTAGILTVSDSGRYHDGAASMSIDCTSGMNNSHVATADSQDLSDITIGFWYYTANWVSNGKEIQCCKILGGGALHKLITLYDQQSWGGVRNLAFTEWGSGVAVSSATWYWIVLNWNAGVGGTLRVYNASHEQVGSDVTTTGSGGDYHTENVDVVYLGISDEFANFAGTINYDDYVIDSTDGTFPLLGWDTAAAAELAGSVAVTSTLAGALRVQKPLAGAVVSSATVAAALHVDKRLAGIIAASATEAAALSVGKPLAGSIDAAATLAGALSVAKNLAGAVAASSDLAGSLSVLKELAGQIDAISTLAGDLSVGAAVTLAGVVAAQATLSGDLHVAKELAASVAAQSSLDGVLQVLKNLSGTSAASSSLSATLEVAKRLAGEIDALSTASGELRVAKNLAGAILAESSVAGQIEVLKNLAGRINAVSTLIGRLAGEIVSGMIAATYTVTKPKITAAVSKPSITAAVQRAHIHVSVTT